MSIPFGKLVMFSQPMRRRNWPSSLNTTTQCPCKCTHSTEANQNYLYRQQTKLRKGNILHLSVSHSVHKGGGEGVSAPVHAGIHHHPPSRRRLLLRTVRILLECILVLFYQIHNSSLHVCWQLLHNLTRDMNIFNSKFFPLTLKSHTKYSLALTAISDGSLM